MISRRGAGPPGTRSRAVRWARRLDRLGELLLVLLLGSLAAAFGAVQPWSELMAVTLAVAGLGLVAWRHAVRPVPLPVPGLLLAGALGLLLLWGFQLVPLPVSVLRWLSPEAAALWGEARPETDFATLSLDPRATRRSLALALVPLSALVMAATARAPGAGRRLVLGVSGLLLGGLGVFWAQRLSGAEAIYGMVPAPIRPSGPFINHNHFAQWTGVASGVAVIGAWGLWRRGSARALGLFALVGLGGASVVASLSRSGSIAFTLGCLLVALPVARRGVVRGPAALAGAAAVAGALLLGMVAWPVLSERLSAALAMESPEIRWRLALDLGRTWTRFPLFGFGQGGFEHVYPAFQSVGTLKRLEHADGDWMQFLAENGLAGAACLLLLGAGVGGVALGAGRRRSGSVVLAGALLGFVVVGLVSVVDFGQRVPAIGAMTAVLVGLLVRAGCGRRVRPGRGAAVGAALGILVVGGWAIAGRVAQWEGARHAGAARQAAEAGRLAEAVRRGRQAVQARPASGHDRLRLARWMWRRIARDVVSPAPGAARLEPERLEAVRRLAAEARVRLPTLARAWLLEGEMSKLLGEPGRAVACIERAAALAPRDGWIAYRTGLEAAARGEEALALERLRRAKRIRAHYGRDAVPVLVDRLGRPGLLLELAGDDPESLAGVRRAFLRRGLESLAAEARRRRGEALEARARSGRATARDLASLGSLRAASGRPREASEWYRLAIDLEPERIGWRLARARALAAAGEPEAALMVVERVLAQQPGHDAAKRLQRELERAGPRARETGR